MVTSGQSYVRVCAHLLQLPQVRRLLWPYAYMLETNVLHF